MMRENGIFLVLLLLDSRLRGNDLNDICRSLGHFCRRLLTPEFRDEPLKRGNQSGCPCNIYPTMHVFSAWDCSQSCENCDMPFRASIVIQHNVIEPPKLTRCICIQIESIRCYGDFCEPAVGFRRFVNPEKIGIDYPVPG
jgi:hypothetical protein